MPCSAVERARPTEVVSLVGQHAAAMKAHGQRAAVEWRVTKEPVPYADAVAFMEERVEAIALGHAPELVWLLEHPALYTAGSSSRDDVTDLPHPVFSSGRGGQVTFHGPGQRVVYVLLDLRTRTKDVRAFVEALQDWIIAALARCGVRGSARADRVGVWVAHERRRANGVEESKIAAIGVRIRQWVTFHGLAINVDPDLAAFAAITPCGITDARYGVTSLADLGLAIDLPALDAALEATFGERFGPAGNVGCSSGTL